MSGSRNFLQKNKRVFLPEIVHQDVLKQANNCALKDEFILEDEFVLFSLYRKFLKSSEIVYNRLEIKNDITKERRGLRHDVVYEVFCFGLG